MIGGKGNCTKCVKDGTILKTFISLSSTDLARFVNIQGVPEVLERFQEAMSQEPL
jgi:hypothetical protein